MALEITLLALGVLGACLYVGWGYIGFVLSSFLGLVAWRSTGMVDPMVFQTVSYVVLGILVLFGFKPLRRLVISGPAMKIAKGVLPTIGETEQIALDAGTVSFEGELFSGKPNWKKLTDFKIKKLSKEEKAFLDGPVEKLCIMLDDEQIFHDRDLSPKVWKFIKDNKCFGIEVSKKDGGLGFSAAAHSAIVTKIASRSVTAAVTVMVPNSLGPAELIHRYGTKKQKDYYIPRLATGKDVPCFALTEPHAGSDAANGRSFGIVCKQKVGGKDTLGIKLTFDKRYITLAPVASLVGLAFRLYDPEKLIGDKEDVGITCALIPRETKGLNIGNRHDPCGVPFQNGPIRGKDVFIPMENVIGGQKYAGQGWRMLMECLSTGRGISLPSLSVGAAQVSARTSTAYASVREQFGLPIGRFEGVRERLARIVGSTYYMDAAKTLTVGAVDAGESPAIASAIAKAYLTQAMRTAVNDGMDIQAGAAICRGPRNIFSRPYASIPVGITVEGANILTRSLIVFGQGAMRCHPYLQKEVEAIQAGNVKDFDTIFFKHINHVARNGVRALVLGLTGGAFANVPKGKHANYYKKLTQMSAAFGFTADLALITLGGALKRKEYLSGRFADAFSWMYIASATLKRAADEGKPQDDPIVDWAVTHALYEAENALIQVQRNLPNRPAAWKARILSFPLGRRYQIPTDKQTDAVVNAALDVKNDLRERLTHNIFIPDEKKPGLGALDATYQKAMAAVPARAKVLKALREKKIGKGTPLEMAAAAEKVGAITKTDHKLIVAAIKAQDDVVQVDDFDPKVFKTLK